MQKEVETNKFDRNIIIAFVFVFLVSFSYKFGGYYYDIIKLFSVIGLIASLLTKRWGLFIFPLSLIFIPMLDSSITFFPFSYSTTYFLVCFIVLAGLLFFKQEKIKKDSNLYLVIIFFLVALVTTILNGYPPGSGNWEFTHYMSAVLVFFILSTVISTKKKLRLFNWVFILFMVSLAFRLFNWVYSYDTAIVGLAGENNHLARLFSFTLFFVIGVFWAEKNIKLKVLILISLAFLANSIVQLGSRATMISVFIAGFLLFIKNITKKSTWIFSLLALILLIFFAPPIFFQDISTISQIKEGTEAEEGSISIRTAIFLEGLELFAERPIIGYGIRPFGFVNAFREKYEDPTLRRNAHNVFLIVAVETGIFGLLSYLFLYISSIYLCFKAQKLTKGKNSYIYYISNGTTFGLIALGINQFMMNQPWQMIFIAAGLSSALYYLAKKENDEFELNLKKSNVIKPEQTVPKKTKPKKLTRKKKTKTK